MSVVDVTSGLAAILVVGPLARETIARFSALDLRLRTDVDGLVLPTGWALGEHLWTVVADAAEQLSGRPVGVDAIGGRSVDA